MPIAVTDNAANERKAIDILQWLHFGCYGHRINLVVKNALALPEISCIIGKGRRVVTFFHQSTSTNDLLLAKQRRLMDANLVGHKRKNDVPTRWNSSLQMLTRLLEQTPAIVAVASDPTLSKTASATLRNCAFSFEEQATVEHLVTVLGPFEKATTLLSADRSPTLQKVLPVLKKLENTLQPNEESPTLIEKVKARMREALKHRTQDKELALLASVLNPFTNDLCFVSDSDRALAYDLLVSRITDLLGTDGQELQAASVTVKQEPIDLDQQEPSDVTDVTSVPALPTLLPAKVEDALPVPEQNTDIDSLTSTVSTEEVAGTQPNKRVKSLKCEDLDEWLEDVYFVGETKLPDADIAKQEIARYQADVVSQVDLSILQWWKANAQFYPHLSVLTRKYLAVPASYVPSERGFSLAGHIVNKKRSRLSPKNVDMMIFLNKNMDYYW